jgi:hypothetical protein
MKRLLACWLACSACAAAAEKPPYHGTIFIDPDIITKDDPSTFQELAGIGRSVRRMFDRRTDRMEEVNAHVFRAKYRDAEKTIDVCVNPEFGSEEAARVHALKFATEVGRLPKCLRRDVDEIWIHGGHQLFGGGNRSLLIHVEQSDEYERDGILEETLVHEACHTSLDDPHATAADWLTAQKQDAGFISNYARDNPLREDIAESFLPWLALRHRRERISSEMAASIEAAMPARIRYFNAAGFDLSPMK